MLPVPRGDRLPHLISPDEVADWLTDSVNRRVTYHRTSAEAARAIVQRGVDVSQSRTGAYGQGFYTATEPDATYGDILVTVAIRLLAPLVGDDALVGGVIDAMTDRLAPVSRRITPPIAAGIRRELISLGYDGLVVVDGGGDGVDYVIALDGQSVRVIEV